MPDPALARLLGERYGPAPQLEAERFGVAPEARRRAAVLDTIPTPAEVAAHRRALCAALLDLEDQ